MSAPTTPVRAVRCRRRARLRVQVGARVWAVCAPCLGALRALWGEGLRAVMAETWREMEGGR